MHAYLDHASDESRVTACIPLWQQVKDSLRIVVFFPGELQEVWSSADPCFPFLQLLSKFLRRKNREVSCSANVLFTGAATLMLRQAGTHCIVCLWLPILDGVPVAVETDKVQQAMGCFHGDSSAWKKLQKNIFKCEALSSKVTFCKMQRTSADNTYTTDAHNSRVNKYLEYSFTIFMLCVHVCVCARVFSPACSNWSYMSTAAVTFLRVILSFSASSLTSSRRRDTVSGIRHYTQTDTQTDTTTLMKRNRTIREQHYTTYPHFYTLLCISYGYMRFCKVFGEEFGVVVDDVFACRSAGLLREREQLLQRYNKAGLLGCSQSNEQYRQKTKLSALPDLRLLKWIK